VELINVYKDLKGRCKEGGARVFSVVPNERSIGNEHKLKNRRFTLNIRKHFFTVTVTQHWHKSPRDVVESILGHIQKLSRHGPGQPALADPA